MDLAWAAGIYVVRSRLSAFQVRCNRSPVDRDIRRIEAMQALVFDGDLQIKNLPIPEPARGEALVRVTMTGICKTDAEIVKGYMRFKGILGHEFVGIVERSENPDLLGLRVVGEINAGCGDCEYCKRGMERHCPNRTVLGIDGRDGAFAEYLTLPERNLMKIPDKLTDEKAVFTEPLAAVLEILEQVKLTPSTRVLVIGDGKLGLLTAMAFHQIGCDLLLVGKHLDKLSIFQEIGGKTITLNRLHSETNRFDVVIEASGHPSGWSVAINHLKPMGVLVLKSTYHGDFSCNPAALVINEISVVGSRCGLFEPALRMLARGLVDPAPLISHVFPFSEAREAFSRSLEPGVFKVLLKM